MEGTLCATCPLSSYSVRFVEHRKKQNQKKFTDKKLLSSLYVLEKWVLKERSFFTNDCMRIKS